MSEAAPPQGDPEPLVSVVTPLYNGEKTLRRCIDSVLQQTYTHWELTLVNNCSTDGSRAIAEEYAARDPRIRIVDNRDFAPVMRNYNLAVAAASPQSRYCKVVAADDFIFPDCLRAMVDLARRHPNVAIVGAYAQREHEVCWDGLAHDVSVLSGRDACRHRLLGGRYYFGTPSSVMYSTEIVRRRERFFNEENLHGDSEACIEFLQDRDFGFVHQVLSFQRTAGESTRTYSQRMQTYIAWELYEVARYGPVYLTEQECEQRMKAQLVDYYRYLGRQVFRFRERAFWAFHREALARAGRPMQNGRVMLHASLVAVETVLSPMTLLRRIARAAMRRLSQGPRTETGAMS